MRNTALVWCLCLSVSSLNMLALAEDLQPLQPGMRLRVTAPRQTPKRIVGTLTTVDSSLLTIQTSQLLVAVPRESIQVLEFSERRSSKKKGAFIGAGVALVAAVIWAVTDKQEPLPIIGEPVLSRNQIGLAAAIVLVPAGAGLGALAAPGERWAPMSTTALGPTPGEYIRGRPLVGLRIRF